MRAMLTICLGAMAFCASGIRAAEEPIALDKLPKAVLETVKKRFPKAELVEAAKETDGDKVESYFRGNEAYNGPGIIVNSGFLDGLDVKAADIPVDKQGHVDFSKDFFRRFVPCLS